MKDYLTIDDILARVLYYRTWCMFQRDNIAFFTYPDKVQDLMVMMFLFSVTNKTLQIIHKYYNNNK